MQGSNRVDLKPDRERRVLHNRIYQRPLERSGLVTSIGIRYLRFTARYNLVCPRFIFVHYLQSTKSPKNISISAVLSPIVPCNFVFRFALLSLCPWLSLVAGFDCVCRRISFAPMLFLVFAAIVSTVSKQQVEATTLLNFPR